MQYRVCTQRQDEMNVRSIEYDSKCESRRFFSACAQSPNYSRVTWDKREHPEHLWSRLATLNVIPDAAIVDHGAANRG